LGDLEAFDRLRAGRALNTFQAGKVLAFCSIWQRSGGSMQGVLGTVTYGRSVAYERLNRCRAAGFEPELVEWRTMTGREWEKFVDLEYRHATADFLERLDRYGQGPRLSRLLHRRPLKHESVQEHEAEAAARGI
jgi:hypothetical protein